jgi:hypothetical protein
MESNSKPLLEPYWVSLGVNKSPTPKTVRSFNEIVCQAIDETLEELIGSRVEGLYVHLKYKFGVDRNELPYRIDTLCSVLEGAFGVKGARVIERKVAKNLYEKIFLPFDDQQGLRLEDFLKLAKETISRDNYYV